MSKIEKLNAEIQELSTIEKLNNEIEDLKKDVERNRKRSYDLNEKRIELNDRISDTLRTCSNTLHTLKEEMMRCKLLTRNIKNISMEFEHENNREFTTKLKMLLEHYKDDIKDMMNKESDEYIIKVMNSVFRFE